MAVVWAAVFARQRGLQLTAALGSVLLLGTWLVYVLDRLLDAETDHGAPAQSPLQSRHRFHHAHRRALLRLAGVAASALCLLATRLAPPLLHLYLALAVPVAVYAAAVHARWPRLVSKRRALLMGGFLRSSPASLASLHPDGGSVAEAQRAARPGFLKEAAVALLFAAAVAAPAASQAGAGQRPALLLTFSLFAMLCWLNCLVITHTEAARAGIPLARRALTAGAVALAAIAALAGSWSGRSHSAYQPAAPAFAAVALSALLLLALLTGRPGPGRAGRVRILADLALLTPLLLASVS